MKKMIFPLIMLIVMMTSAIANNTNIIGVWLLTTAEMNGKTDEVYQLTSFKDDGYAEIQGRVFGSWEYNSKNKTITIESEMIKEFSGDWKIDKSTKDELVLKSNKSKLNFIKYDEKKIEKENKKSGLSGAWKLTKKNEEEADVFISFKFPNTIKVKTMAEGMSSSGSGMWIYNAKDKTVVMTVRDQLLGGMSKIEKINAKGFELNKDGQKITALKLEQNANDREKLSVTSGGNSERDRRQELDREKFSWFNYEAALSYLKNVKNLKYIKSTLLVDFDAFAREELTAKVAFSENDQQLTIDPIFGDLSSRENDQENMFYPIQEIDDYTIIGEKMVSVPAGTFKCTAIETFDDFRNIKVRYYMINNRPGIYAKIIIVDEDNYTMYELAGIEGDLKSQDNKKIIGKWLIVKIKTDGKTSTQSTNLEFINDGRLSVNNTTGGEYFTWSNNKDNNTVTLNFGDKVQELKITKLTDTEMELQNDKLGYWLVKIKAPAVSEKNPKLLGYWMLIESGEAYKTIQLKENNEIFQIDNVNQAPIDKNYPELKGKWIYNSSNSTIVFNTDQWESLCYGQYKIKKLDENVLVLSRDGGGQLVFLKIDPERITKNNKASGIEGRWEITGWWDKKTKYFEFKAPYMCYLGFSKDALHPGGLWFYNPEINSLFIGYSMHQLGGEAAILKISKDEITFQNGLKAVRIK